MSATIVLGGQSFKDRVLEKVPYGRRNAVTIKKLHQDHFPDHLHSDVQHALCTLRGWPGTVECTWQVRACGGRELLYWRP